MTVSTPAAESGRARIASRLAVPAVVAAGGMLIAVLRRFPPSSTALLLLLGAAPVLLVWLARRDVRETLIWAAYVVAFILFAGLRGMADELGIAARAGYVLDLERAVFLGVHPTSWLQERLYSLGDPTWFDWSMAWVHVSYFLVPHLVGLIVWAYHREHLARYFAATILIYYGALAVQAAVPTVPPWMAGMSDGFPHVYRILEDIAARHTPATYERVYAIAGANDVAAMPSLHTAITVLVALMAARIGRIAGVLGWSYAAAMAFALVYLGEHYAVDTIAGAALAVAVWRGSAGLVRRGDRREARAPSREMFAHSGDHGTL